MTTTTSAAQGATETAGPHQTKLINMVGRAFGKLTVLSRSYNERRGEARWLCVCACGSQTVTAGHKLRSGHTRSCGCLRPTLGDLTGQKFGQLTAIVRAENSRAHHRYECLCECGNTATVMAQDLSRGHTQSCGCLARFNSQTHGGRYMPEYKVWSGMLTRCRNSNQNSFRHYGGRGVTVCERWLDFSNFISDMGHRPSAQHQLDRINNDGDYEPSNCKWSTPIEQANNKRSNRRVTVRGVDFKSATEAARLYGVPPKRAQLRLRRGWTPEQTFGLDRRASEQQQQLPLIDAPSTAPAESLDHENV